MGKICVNAGWSSAFLIFERACVFERETGHISGKIILYEVHGVLLSKITHEYKASCL